MDTRTKEAIRYLGYGRKAIDDRTLALVSEAFMELDELADKRIVYRIFEFSVLDSEWMTVEHLYIHSKNLFQNMKGCEKAVLLGATLGIGVDRLIRRYSCTDMARAVVVQACAAAVLEEYLDGWQEELRVRMEKDGYYLRPRFSPGYGDFSIEYQEDILHLLDSARKIGIFMTESSMLIPAKSVTALIGLSRLNIACHKAGCEMCEKTDCSYRRDTVEKRQRRQEEDA